ncbi:MAG: hypothetical protein J7K82_01915 [Thermoproteales archaeon]|nr:hypothetical protein [Thermoproteales archaeon]
MLIAISNCIILLQEKEKKYGKETEKVEKSVREEFTEIFEVFQPEEE